MIPCSKPSITDLEIRYVDDAMHNGWGKHCYDYINRFEKAFCEHLGVKHAIATSSCTGALHIGLMALGIGLMNDVVLADINWIATVSAIQSVEAGLEFIDIDQKSWCINIGESYLPNNDTDAIIATHLYGNLCDMDELMEISNKYNITIIEDAAEAIGSKYHGRYAGTIGKFGVFSFHGTKTMTTGEGGMFVTNDTELYKKALIISNHGRRMDDKRKFYCERIGLKYKMSNIQAALGCAQLERLSELIARKRGIMEIYRELLKDVEKYIEMNPEPEGCFNSYWMPTVVFNKELNINRDMLMSTFVSNGIDARPFFYPLSSFPMCHGNKNNVVAYSISNRAINLPSFHDITLGEQKTVAKVVKNIIKEIGN